MIVERSVDSTGSASDQNGAGERNVLIYHISGGTCDVSLLNVDDGNSLVHDAVVPVHAYLNVSQRRATNDSGQICGFNGLRILTRMVRASAMFSFIT